MSVLGIGSEVNNLLTYGTVQNTTKTDKLKETLEAVSNDESADNELLEACKSFEAYFVEQMFKEMKKTVKSEDEENEYTAYFGEMLTQTYAENATEGEGVGIAQLLYESMKRNGIS